MANITIKMRDGSVRRFDKRMRAGGSWTNSVAFEGAFVVIEDEWGKRTAIPVELVAEVIEDPVR